MTDQSRRALLVTLFTSDRLPPMPAVAMRVYQLAEAPDCDPAELAGLLSTDPALCAGLLRAANSCVYGLARPVSSAARAIQVLGRRAVRALTLSLSAPGPRGRDPGARDYWLTSIGGALIARELAAAGDRPAPDEDMAAALLRDVGAELLRRTFPAKWIGLRRAGAHPQLANTAAEQAVFGADHADIGAELLSRWGLPADVTEPIRHHHHPNQLPAGPLGSRAELLWLSDCLMRLDVLADHPKLMDPVLEAAQRDHGLDVPALSAFLTAIAPKVEAFAQALDVGAVQCPDLAVAIA
ncbi:HDOD domain protein [Gemmata obscuriglobus]|uniref:HDOD domain-containing protein n=1 Tax=Gemmata obscuriglobus TaxID=114 RepID=A0A2Z3GXT8_9BACT|nr:HDOD domain-containing protein [Gemmata obscuriglobus]AWM39299.1 HDOD domain-containing protein [Gemmata obscuriglobus]QEG27639.1 HDOD domain protein [Gemmata obscuriglobus]VTS04801.1 Diguanylate cyclase OS=Desulfuromonas acetoxidans DSM 684 GN=Dace_1778 PE=4 SV=1: HDOD [Gemmata obscuriglobus UQM 2246]